MVSSVKLGLNIDHIATLREARGGSEPSVLQAAFEGIRGGADGITVHLREDRRHIQDYDVTELRKKISVPLNLEMSISPSIVKIACTLRPQKACLVPECRAELTTEGGLDVVQFQKRVAACVRKLQSQGILVSLFIDPIREQIKAAWQMRADFIELHTGCYANATGKRRSLELKRLREGASFAHTLGLGINAGHGLDFKNVGPVAKIPNVSELNIGHAIISDAVFNGLISSVRRMKHLIKNARSSKHPK